MTKSMQIRYRILHDGEDRTVTAKPVSIIAFERHWGVGFMTAIREPRLEWHAWIAHDACHKHAVSGNHPAVKPFDEWLAGLDDIDVVDEEAPERPLAGTPSP